jgi:hypothetical protein
MLSHGLVIGSSGSHSSATSLYRRESNLAISFSLVTKIMYSLLLGVLLLCEKLRISSSAPGLSVMTHRECHVDRPFPVT